MENKPVYIWEGFSIKCPAQFQWEWYLFIFSAPPHDVIRFHLASRTQTISEENNLVQFGADPVSQPASPLLVRVQMCDVWVMERVESPQGGNPTHLFNRGFALNPKQQQLLQSGLASLGWFYIILFLFICIADGFCQNSKFWVLSSLGEVDVFTPFCALPNPLRWMCTHCAVHAEMNRYSVIRYTVLPTVYLNITHWWGNKHWGTFYFR